MILLFQLEHVVEAIHKLILISLKMQAKVLIILEMYNVHISKKKVTINLRFGEHREGAVELGISK